MLKQEHLYKSLNHFIFIGFIISLFSILAIGCGGGGPSVSITASPSTINLGESSILTWSTAGADSVSINNGVGTVQSNGNIVVSPFKTTTYTISAVNANGSERDTVTIVVKTMVSAPTVSLKAEPPTIVSGSFSTLSWSASNAYSVMIDNDIGTVPHNYSMTVSPPTTTTYNIYAIGPGGTSTASVTVNVISGTPFVSIQANPINIKPGDTVTLTWDSANADSVMIDQGIGKVLLSGSHEVQPTITTTYTITATGVNGIATASITVFVGESPNPILVAIRAEPAMIYPGNPSKLIWEVLNANSAEIDQGIGAVSLIGSMEVSPNETTTYTIKATNNGHSAYAKVTINIIQIEAPTITYFQVKPSNIQPGQSGILTWETTNANSVEIDNGIGSVALSGSMGITPNKTTTFVMTAKGVSGLIATDSVTINIAPPTGNQDFVLIDALQYDPLNGYRVTGNNVIINQKLPSLIDHSAYLPEVKDQGLTGSCTSWSLAYYLKSYYENKEMVWDINDNAFSPMYAYALQCRLFEKPNNIMKTLELMQNLGCPKWTSLPFEDLEGCMDQKERNAYASIDISESIHKEAKPYRMGEIQVLTNLNQIKLALTTNPIILVINSYSLFTPSAPVTPENNYLRPDENNDNASHSLICVGFDDNQFQEGALHIVSSWGKEWGINGYSWIKYADASKIITLAMAVNDLNNPIQTAFRLSRPNPPTQVQATKDIGPYVDITWIKDNTALYYRIYRAATSNRSNTDLPSYPYELIGESFKTSYRDYPTPGVSYYYAVVSVNEFGESDFFEVDTDALPYIDEGLASGESINPPTLEWRNDALNNEGISYFEINSIDPAIQLIGVEVSENSHGPWHNFGWIAPGKNFAIHWSKTTFLGKRPYIRIYALGDNCVSVPSLPVLIDVPILTPQMVPSIRSIQAFERENGIQVEWDMVQDNPDFFEIWRKDAMKLKSLWVLLDVVSKDNHIYHDKTAIPGILYYYAVVPVLNGAKNEPTITQEPVSIALQGPNLTLIHSECPVGQIKDSIDSFPITVMNNGNQAIENYSFKILAFNWKLKHSVDIFSGSASDYQMISLPLQPGQSHILPVAFELPQEISQGIAYTWYIWIDSNTEIDESSEDDNLLWDSKAFWK